MRRDILIEAASGEIRTAVLEDDLLTEIVIERPWRRGVVGNVYKGRVSTVLPGMASAFVDCGLERDAFLYVEDTLPDPSAREREAWDEAPAPPDEPRVGGIAAAPERRAAIEDRVRVGQEIIVQVTKDPVALKGARITSHIALPGRFLVYLPGVEHVGVSRRIEDPAERDRLRALVTPLAADLGLPGGFIVRTAGVDRAADEFRSDALDLKQTWEALLGRAERSGAPALLHAEVGAVARVLRDVLGGNVERVLVDTPEVLRQAIEFVRRVQPSLASRVHRHEGPGLLFDDRSVSVQLERALRPRVWLKSGGSIVINPTEALVAIDVNTGKYVGRRRLEETIVRTNLEAVGEIVRQIRLRDLGGIIVIDFIDMQDETSKQEVLRALETELRRDRARSRMLQISEFGLVEITRQRSRPSLERTLRETCPGCGGSGQVRSAETLWFEVVRAGLRLAHRAGGTLVVRAHPGTLEGLLRARDDLAERPGVPPVGPITFRADPALRLDQVEVDPG